MCSGYKKLAEAVTVAGAETTRCVSCVRSALLALIFLLLRRLRRTALPSGFADLHTHTNTDTHALSMYIISVHILTIWLGNSGVCVIFWFIVNRFAHILGIYLLLCELIVAVICTGWNHLLLKYPIKTLNTCLVVSICP